MHKSSDEIKRQLSPYLCLSRIAPSLSHIPSPSLPLALSLSLSLFLASFSRYLSLSLSLPLSLFSSPSLSTSLSPVPSLSLPLSHFPALSRSPSPNAKNDGFPCLLLMRETCAKSIIACPKSPKLPKSAIGKNCGLTPKHKQSQWFFR